MSGSHALHHFMKQATTLLQFEYDWIFDWTTQDPGTAGDQGETNWAAFLRGWLPSHFHVETKGRIMGNNGQLSPQVDVVVLKPSYPKKLLTEQKIWLADGVAAAFECKNTLTSAHLKEAIATAGIIKRLSRKKLGTPVNELRSSIFYGVLAHSHSWKQPKSKPIDNVLSAFHSAVAGVKDPRYLLDVICVADLACWMQQFRIEPNVKGAEEWPKDGKEPFVLGTVLVRHVRDAALGSDDHKPIASLLTHVTKLLALQDEQSRDLARCFEQVFEQVAECNDWGANWSTSIMSKQTHSMLLQRWRHEYDAWDGWQRAF
jgi:hypothetical protein